MELNTPLWQPSQEFSTTEIKEIPETNFSKRDVFKLFRRLELLSQRQGVVAEVILVPVAETYGQRFKVSIRPVFGDEDVKILEKARPRFESEVEIALHSNLCPVVTPEDLKYPKEWLASVLPYLGLVPELRERIFPLNTTNPVDENTFIDSSESFFPHYRYEYDTGYLDLDACTNEEIYEEVFSAFERQLLTVLEEFWRNGVVGMTEAEAAQWQCRRISSSPSVESLENSGSATGKALYQAQARYLCVISVASFLLDRLAGLPYLLNVGQNLVARHAAARILNVHQGETIFFRDCVAITIKNWEDYEVISEVRQAARAARGTARIGVGLLEPKEGMDSVTYFVLDTTQITISSILTP